MRSDSELPTHIMGSQSGAQVSLGPRLLRKSLIWPCSRQKRFHLVVRGLDAGKELSSPPRAGADRKIAALSLRLRHLRSYCSFPPIPPIRSRRRTLQAASRLPPQSQPVSADFQFLETSRSVGNRFSTRTGRERKIRLSRLRRRRGRSFRQVPYVWNRPKANILRSMRNGRLRSPHVVLRGHSRC